MRTPPRPAVRFPQHITLDLSGNQNKMRTAFIGFGFPAPRANEKISVKNEAALAKVAFDFFAITHRKLEVVVVNRG